MASTSTSAAYSVAKRQRPKDHALAHVHREPLPLDREAHAVTDIDLDAIDERRNSAEENPDMLVCQRASADDTPSGRLRATESHDQGADDGAGTEGSRAQGGARGDETEYWRRITTEAAERNRKPAPADPVGLDAAIEAALIGSGHSEDGCGCPPGEDIPCPEYVADVRHIIRAAAPHLRAAALLEAADDLKIRLRNEFWGYANAGLVEAERLLRERAGRIGGGE